VAGVISGPTEGPVPNAGGMPGGVAGAGEGACGSALAQTVRANAALARPSAEPFRNWRRGVLMGGILPRVHAYQTYGIEMAYSVP